MKQKRTTIMLSLVLVAALMASILQVQAYARTLQPQSMNAKCKTPVTLKATQIVKAAKAVRNGVPALTKNGDCLTQAATALEYVDEISLDEVDEVDIDALVAEYESLPEEEKKLVPGVWIVWVRGLSWEREDIPVISAAIPEGTPVGLRMVAKAIWSTPEWTLYKIVKANMGQNGTRYELEGYALYKKDTGRFHLSLRGDGVTRFNAVGKVYGNKPTTDSCKNCRYLRVVMKGRMTVEGDDYVFAMRGCAHRLWLLRARPEPVPKEILSGSDI